MKLLDLYCCEGIGAWGYWLSGCFSEIVGVDINPEFRDRYSFDFICGDALELDYEFLMQFDFIHASPPCQGYSKMTPDQSKHMRLVAATHLMLVAAGKPYCIENVEGSSRELRPNLVMDGHFFGLELERRRYFHVSSLVKPARLMRSAASINVHGGAYVRRADVVKAMGLEVINKNRLKNLSMHGMEQGIPPVMTKWIAQTVIGQKAMIA